MCMIPHMKMIPLQDKFFVTWSMDSLLQILNQKDYKWKTIASKYISVLSGMVGKKKIEDIQIIS